ncbi:bacteriocin immunity protein [Lactobacillus xylocopicola]|uniref:Bacteriocin immunity protein n=1 Tax=Lactobacillus xylocopicola TaxID=2976676 RepID=A0ABN6SPS7_9LACO|nr:bacteriocin immunity protein [Lactobacillus xylocopicola]BDR61082.1 hypothetical protein KIM322_13430 [Lactobacillus xylocopicola]
MKQERPEQILLTEIDSCLQSPITAAEKKLFLNTKKRLEKRAYFPAIVNSLKMELTPLAIRQELSESGRKIYKLLLDPKFPADKGLGIGLATIFGGHVG